MINILYGAGAYAEIFCKELELNNIKIEYIIDEYSNKEYLCNKKILRLSDATLSSANIYISVSSPIFEKDIINNLINKNTKKIITFIEVITFYPRIISKCLSINNMWFNKLSHLIPDDKISILKTLLQDNHSKQLLEDFILFRKTLDPKYYPKPIAEIQYFPNDIKLFKNINNIRFIDGGAFIGDSLDIILKCLSKQDKKIDYIISFEPDQKNIMLLNQEIEKQKQIYSDVDFLVYPCGLWSENDILSFSNDGTSTSSIISNSSKDNLFNISVVSLDSTIKSATPNYIKLDIEGAEKEAIIGMQNIIKSSSPLLAISLYHKSEDLWELPLLINNINPNYNMYIRLYEQMGLELVLYCVPKEYNV